MTRILNAEIQTKYIKGFIHNNDRKITQFMIIKVLRSHIQKLQFRITFTLEIQVCQAMIA